VQPTNLHCSKQVSVAVESLVRDVLVATLGAALLRTEFQTVDRVADLALDDRSKKPAHAVGRLVTLADGARLEVAVSGRDATHVDTLYSAVVLDLSEPATVVLPDTGGRYQSLEVINQDHYSFSKIEPGRYDHTEEAVGSRYAYLIVRTFMDADDPDDVKAANAMQDVLAVEGGGSGPLDTPDWNLKQLATARDALNTLANTSADLGSVARNDGTSLALSDRFDAAYLPITDGWNDAIRMYEPEPEISTEPGSSPRSNLLDEPRAWASTCTRSSNYSLAVKTRSDSPSASLMVMVASLTTKAAARGSASR
jgi:hypothetical protein